MIYKILLLLPVLMANPAQAVVYKCKLASGNIEYQAKPCPDMAVKAGKVQIPPLDPRSFAQAQQRFAEWQTEQDRLAVIKRQQEKAQYMEMERQFAADALLNSGKTRSTP